MSIFRSWCNPSYVTPNIRIIWDDTRKSGIAGGYSVFIAWLRLSPRRLPDAILQREVCARICRRNQQCIYFTLGANTHGKVVFIGTVYICTICHGIYAVYRLCIHAVMDQRICSIGPANEVDGSTPGSTLFVIVACIHHCNIYIYGTILTKYFGVYISYPCM